MIAVTHAYDQDFHGLASVYEKATLRAENETGIDRARFPRACPYTIDQILAPGFFPDDAATSDSPQSERPA